MKDKKVRRLMFVGNPFVEEVEAYRIWTISNNPKLADLDGQKVSSPHVPTHVPFLAFERAPVLTCSRIAPACSVIRR